MHKDGIGLITCTSSRAIYLDLVPDATSRECIELLKRFMARYGTPSNIISDNGTCFKSEETQNFVANRNIVWKFNLESAPWQGGFFERMVQSVKRILRKLLMCARLNFLELLTLLKNIELIINNRPLTYVYDEITEPPLTPNHLIYGRMLNQVNTDTEITHEEDDSNVINRTGYTKKLLYYFWQRWKNEYILELRERYRSHNANSELNVDDVVLVTEDKQPCYLWRIGRVQELIRGKNNIVRGAVVLTKSKQGSISSLRRPVNQLVLLEIFSRSIGNKDSTPDDVPSIKFCDEHHIKTNI